MVRAFFKALEAAAKGGGNVSEALSLYSRLLILMNDCNIGEENRFPTKYTWHSLGLSQEEALKTLIGMSFNLLIKAGKSEAQRLV